MIVSAAEEILWLLNPLTSSEEEDENCRSRLTQRVEEPSGSGTLIGLCRGRLVLAEWEVW